MKKFIYQCINNAMCYFLLTANKMTKKHLLVLLLIIIVANSAMGQSPGLFSYQFVLRDQSGNVLPNQQVGAQICILKDTPEGESIYCENHNIASNPFGVARLLVGSGDVISGNFNNIHWGEGSFYLQSSVDLAGIGNFTLVETSELLSVPYALQTSRTSKTNTPMLTQEDIDNLEARIGEADFNTTSNCLNIYMGNGAWWELCGEECTPQPTSANAGPDQPQVAGVQTNLAGNIPVFGEGEWSILSGNGGSIAQADNPASIFFGQAGVSYQLEWGISNACGTSADQVMITFQPATNLFTITTLADPPEGGNTSGDGTYIEGTQVTVTAGANDNWVFVNWKEDGNIVSSDMSYTFNILSDRELTAIFHGPISWPTCTGIPIVYYEEQVYNTILIGNQCWLRENLNVGIRIISSQNMTNNGQIEKYCYNNLDSNCDIYGGLYQWDEMMLYSTSAGSQGICPEGWHIPTDDEWKSLEGTVDSQYPVGDPIWNGTGGRGFDAGKNLKSISGWSSNGNGIDLYWFTGLPGGLRWGSGGFIFQGEVGYFQTSNTLGVNIIDRTLGVGNEIYRWNQGVKSEGRSVRCMKD